MRRVDTLDAIGNTPLVELPRITPKQGVRIFAKMEGNNPTGSLKDRIAKYMIEHAERSGELTKDKTILEPTSGNPANPLAHYETTGVEILNELPEVDVFVAGLGTGGTLMGVGRRLKEVNPKTKVIAVEPHPGDLVQGLRSLGVWHKEFPELGENMYSHLWW